MTKNAFYFILKTLSVLKFFVLNFFGPVEKRFDKKAKINFKIFDVSTCETKNYYTHIAQHLKK